MLNRYTAYIFILNVCVCVCVCVRARVHACAWHRVYTKNKTIVFLILTIWYVIPEDS
jgi:hypothetical protein